MRKLTSLAVLLLSCTFLFSQENLWTSVNESATGANLFASRTRPTAYKIFQLRESDFISRSQTAPNEKIISASQSSSIISFPDEKGNIQRFRVVEAPVMHEALAARYPGIKSFSGKGIDDPSSTVRFSVSEQLGVYGMILSSNKPSVYIDPVDRAGRYYMVVSRNAIGGQDRFQCLTENAIANSTPEVSGVQLRNADDGILRTYRLALCASGEYSQSFLTGSEPDDAARKAVVLAALNNAMTRTNGIYERDFAVRMVLVPNNDAVIYLNTSTDPFTSSGSWGNQSQATCDGVIGSSNYDIGHSITYAAPPGNGNAGCIGCVCTAGIKGKGWTAYYDFASDYFVVDFMTHEMGHQFGGNHTFSISYEGTIAQTEPGSGSTIMGYAGITGSTDVQPHSDDYFHAKSIEQITNYVKSTSSTCEVATATGNAIPTANAGADYTIPKSTPFKLDGSGTDGDVTDVLTYCWEEIDIITGARNFPTATATNGVQFRSYLPSTNTSRNFPILSSILSGTNGNTWEVLPSVARTLNFRLTVKDNRAGGGGNRSDDMTVTISSATGPFAVSAPNTAVTWAAGTSQTVTWTVNGTTGSPVNCANVNILLSTDGGNTFPIVLLSNTPNDGTQSVTVPNNPGTTNRVKVEAAGNIFFDISNANFTIGAPPVCGDVTGLNTTAITTTSATVNWSTVASALSYDVDYKAASSGTWINAATATTTLSVNLISLASGTLYDWRVRSNCTGGSGNYIAAQFTTTAVVSPCPGIYDISTNGTTGGAAVIPFNTDVKGTISPSGDVDNYRFNVNTGGPVVITLTTLPANYQLRLLNSAGTILVTSANNGTASETINATVAAGFYYVRVYPKGNASNSTNCYTLRVQANGSTTRGDGGLITGTGINVNLFPNPANNKLNIAIDGLQTTADIKVYNVMGKLVMRQIATKANSELNISRLSSGIYMLNVNDGTTVKSMKFVKE